MDTGWMGYEGTRKQASIGELVVCVDSARLDANGSPREFVGLILDKSVSVYKIQVVDSNKIVYWPMTATYLWKETK